MEGLINVALPLHVIGYLNNTWQVAFLFSAAANLRSHEDQHRESHHGNAEED